MKQIIEFIAHAIEGFKTSMDHYGEARIIINSCMVNDHIIRKTKKTK